MAPLLDRASPTAVVEALCRDTFSGLAKPLRDGACETGSAADREAVCAARGGMKDAGATHSIACCCARTLEEWRLAHAAARTAATGHRANEFARGDRVSLFCDGRAVAGGALLDVRRSGTSLLTGAAGTVAFPLPGPVAAAAHGGRLMCSGAAVMDVTVDIAVDDPTGRGAAGCRFSAVSRDKVPLGHAAVSQIGESPVVPANNVTLVVCSHTTRADVFAAARAAADSVLFVCSSSCGGQYGRSGPSRLAYACTRKGQPPSALYEMLRASSDT